MCPIDKLADDTGLTGLTTNDDDSHCRQEVDRLVDWCEKFFLVLNVGKTEELIIDFSRKKPNYKPIMAKEDVVEQVEKCRYLGLVIHNKKCLARKY